jgi:glycosyltransferase involved in cell wall biosynthesis
MDNANISENAQDASAPQISIIIAVLNGAATLDRCIDSISLQTWHNKELIIIDGGSKDDTLRIIKSRMDLIAYWESMPDRGIYHAWNKALSHANGDWICFIGSDDYLWKHDVLERMVPSMMIAETMSIRLVYGRLASIGTTGKVRALLGAPWDKATGLITHKMPPSLSLMHHSSIFKDHGMFDESFRIAGDYELLLRELKTNDALFVPDIITTGMTYGGISCSIKHIRRLIVEDILARKKHNISLITFPIIKYYIKLLLNSISY